MHFMNCISVLVLFMWSSHCYQFSPDVFSPNFVVNVNAVANTWVAGHNFPINITKEELGFLIDLSGPSIGYNPESISRERASESAESYKSITKSTVRRFQDALDDTDIPASFDSRIKWPKCPNIGKVLNQGACPSSYAFAVVPAFSDRRCIQSDGHHPEPLSIEYLLSCCHACKLKDNTRVCGAGQAITAWWFLHKRGIVTGGEYGSSEGCQPVSFPPCNRVFSDVGSFCTDQTAPSLRCHTRCTNENYSVPYSQDRHRGKIQYWVNTQVSSIQREILKSGPVTAQISVHEDFLHYKSGVYRHVMGKRFPHQHTLKLIGWGEQEGTPYWLLINSWGKQWGDEGTVKILRGRAECYIEYFVSAAMPKKY